MPDLQTPTRSAATPAAPAVAAGAAVGAASGAVSNSAVAASLQSRSTPARDPQDVALYLTLNNTTHDRTELPEALSALKQAEAAGLGHKELLPVSDPYWSEPKEGDIRYDDPTYAYSFGADAAKRVQFWHGDPTLQSGQVRTGAGVQQLGSSGVNDWEVDAIARVRQGWTQTLLTLGMAPSYADKVVLALLSDGKGNFRNLASGDGATNELLQYAMVMYRSEIGEIDVTDIVFSGHHYGGDTSAPDPWGQGIWGEIPGASQQEAHYDDTDDFFGLLDVAALRQAFPKAYAKVKAVQFAACNTDRLGMPNGAGGVQTTEQFLQQTYPGIQLASYWNTLAPIAAVGFETNGEFLLDSARLQGGQPQAATNARHNPTGLKRAVLGPTGTLAPITMKTDRTSYAGDSTNGLRGTSSAEFDQRADLADHLYTSPSLPAQKR